jgi:hypothetical protein
MTNLKEEHFHVRMGETYSGSTQEVEAQIHLAETMEEFVALVVKEAGLEVVMD